MRAERAALAGLVRPGAYLVNNRRAVSARLLGGRSLTGLSPHLVQVGVDVGPEEDVSVPTANPVDLMPQNAGARKRQQNTGAEAGVLDRLRKVEEGLGREPCPTLLHGLRRSSTRLRLLFRPTASGGRLPLAVRGQEVRHLVDVHPTVRVAGNVATSDQGVDCSTASPKMSAA